MNCKNCGKEINKFSKTGYCKKCYPSTEDAKKKNSIGVSRAHKDGKYPEDCFGISRAWSKGLTKDTDERLKKWGENYSSLVKEGKLIPRSRGRKLTKEHREKISQSSAGGKNGFVKTKYYDLFCPYENKFVKVQGTWELRYGIYLNENNIKWIRSRKINLRFKYFEQDINRTYFPDFYLLDSKEFIEVKGYFSKLDQEKMIKVKENNKETKITILQKDDLELLGINLAP